MRVLEKGHVYSPENRIAHKGEQVAEQTLQM